MINQELSCLIYWLLEQEERGQTQLPLWVQQAIFRRGPAVINTSTTFSAFYSEIGGFLFGDSRFWMLCYVWVYSVCGASQEERYRPCRLLLLVFLFYLFNIHVVICADIVLEWTGVKDCWKKGTLEQIKANLNHTQRLKDKTEGGTQTNIHSYHVCASERQSKRNVSVCIWVFIMKRTWNVKFCNDCKNVIIMMRLKRRNKWLHSTSRSCRLWLCSSCPQRTETTGIT